MAIKPNKQEQAKYFMVGGYHTEEDAKKYIEAFRASGLSDEQIKLIIMYCGGYAFEGEYDGKSSR